MKYMIFVFFFLSTSLWAEAYPITTVPHKYHDLLLEYCETYQVPSYYMARLIQWESGWKDKRIHVNPDGTTDFGLGQLNSKSIPDFIRWHNAGKAFDPLNGKENLRISVMHLRFLYERTGSWWSAVAAYNMGQQGFEDWCAGKRPLPPGTRKELNFVFQ